MGRIIIAVLLSAIFTAGGGYATVQYLRGHEITLSKRRSWLCGSVTLILFVGYSVFFSLCAKPPEYSLLYVIRHLCALYSVYFIAYIDFRLMIIPNRFLLGMLALLLPIMTAEALTDWNAFLPTAIQSLIGAAVGGGIFLFGRIISRSGMGMGDVKLMLVLGLYLGFYGVIGVIFWSLLASVIGGMLLMIFKKKTLKEKLPMGPFFLVGTLIGISLFVLNS